MIRSTLGLVLATILFAACAAPVATPSQSTIPSIATPTVPPSSAAAPTASPEPSASALTGWQLVTIPSAVPDRWATPAAVAAGPAGLVAVGGTVHAAGVNEGPLYATTWRSTDGLAWEPSQLEPVLEVGLGNSTSGPEIGLFDVAYGPGGFVALGYATTDDSLRVAIWQSSDGSAWQRVPLPDDVFDNARPAALEAGGPGYVIVGGWLDLFTPPEKAAPPRAAIWTSPDGRTWTRVPNQTGLGVGGYIDTGEERVAGGMLDVTATSGGLVAVGQTCKAVNLMEKPLGLGSSCRSLLWTSPDAMNWTRIDPHVAVHPGSTPAIAAADERVVAVGGAWSRSPARYTLRSSDGTSWRWDEDAGQSRLDGIVSVPGTFMATSHDAGQIRLSTSPDGRAWTVVSGIPKMSAGPSIRESDIVAMPDRVVIVGWREGEEDPAKSAFALIGPLDIE